MHNTYTYLALGDSYTIGESVLLHESFPYQVVQLLRKNGFNFLAPEIIAQTGWTTDELSAAIKNYEFLNKYDFVTLLIGVNNQYRGKEIVEYTMELEGLLEKSIALTGNKPEHVYLISIPDYSVTPFGQKKETEKTAKEIDIFNTANKAVSIQYKVGYLDITESSKKAKDDTDLVAEDGLHPSPKMYGKWAKKLASLITAQVKEKVK